MTRNNHNLALETDNFAQDQIISRRNLIKSAALASGMLAAWPGVSWAASAESAYSQELTELLNLALKHEYGAVVQYSNHAGLLCHWVNQDPARTIQAVIADEVDHAVTLTRFLIQSGAKPTLAVWPPQTGDSPARVINQDIAAEQSAISLYSRILELDLDPELGRVIETIIEAEQSHKKIFQELAQEIRS
ncbi:MAG: ferritin-like domain-containing protein [Desulfonatronovibrionaceae bacterium]